MPCIYSREDSVYKEVQVLLGLLVPQNPVTDWRHSVFIISAHMYCSGTKDKSTRTAQFLVLKVGRGFVAGTWLLVLGFFFSVCSCVYVSVCLCFEENCRKALCKCETEELELFQLPLLTERILISPCRGENRGGGGGDAAMATDAGSVSWCWGAENLSSVWVCVRGGGEAKVLYKKSLL